VLRFEDSASLLTFTYWRRLLSRFFAESTSALFPKFIVIEHTANIPSKACTRIGGDAVRLLSSKGYRVHSSNKDNHIMVL
jgi:hypothetical protein